MFRWTQDVCPKLPASLSFVVRIKFTTQFRDFEILFFCITYETCFSMQFRFWRFFAHANSRALVNDETSITRESPRYFHTPPPLHGVFICTRTSADIETRTIMRACVRGVRGRLARLAWRNCRIIHARSSLINRFRRRPKRKDRPLPF